MAEAEFGGVKFKGGKIFVLLTALSTLGGVAWGGFEFYNDYRTMKTKINKYVAPVECFKSENDWCRRTCYRRHRLYTRH